MQSLLHRKVNWSFFANSTSGERFVVEFLLTFGSRQVKKLILQIQEWEGNTKLPFEIYGENGLKFVQDKAEKISKIAGKMPNSR